MEIQLFKQILSDRSTLSFVSEQFTSDQEVITVVKQFNDDIVNNKVLAVVKTLFENFNSYDLEKIYINSKELASVSNALLKDWSKIRNAVLENKIIELGANPSKTKISAVEKEVKNKDFSIAELASYNDKYLDKEGNDKEICSIANVVLEAVGALEIMLAESLPADLKTLENKNKVKGILDAYENLLHLRWKAKAFWLLR